MGLDTTHNCWHGGYTGFNIWRNAVCRAAGWIMAKEDAHDYPIEINWDAITEANLAGDWEREPEDPLVILAAHYDHAGVIHPAHAAALADRLEELIDKLENTEAWDYRQLTQRFIAGLRLAATAGEDVEFH